NVEVMLRGAAKHGAEFGVASRAEYLSLAREVVRRGTPVEYIYRGELRRGYVQIMGNRTDGATKFALVGTDAAGNITTLHIESGNSFWNLLNKSVLDKTIRSAK
ncbi:MAG: hypothetical protein AAB393_19490, partial [Bacteroidota bacterium]